MFDFTQTSRKFVYIPHAPSKDNNYFIIKPRQATTRRMVCSSSVLERALAREGAYLVIPSEAS